MKDPPFYSGVNPFDWAMASIAMLVYQRVHNYTYTSTAPKSSKFVDGSAARDRSHQCLKEKNCHEKENHHMDLSHIPYGSMYAIYANIWGLLMVQYGIHVTIYTIHGSYGYWVPQLSTALLRGKKSQNFHPSGFASRAAPCWANFPGTNDDPQFCRVLIGSPFQHKTGQFS